MTVIDVARFARALFKSGRFRSLGEAQIAAEKIIANGGRGVVMNGFASVAQAIALKHKIPLRDAQVLLDDANRKRAPQPIEPKREDETTEAAQARADRTNLENMKKASDYAITMAARLLRDGTPRISAQRQTTRALGRFYIDAKVAEGIANDAVEKAPKGKR